MWLKILLLQRSVSLWRPNTTGKPEEDVLCVNAAGNTQRRMCFQLKSQHITSTGEVVGYPAFTYKCNVFDFLCLFFFRSFYVFCTCSFLISAYLPSVSIRRWMQAVFAASKGPTAGWILMFASSLTSFTSTSSASFRLMEGASGSFCGANWSLLW